LPSILSRHHSAFAFGHVPCSGEDDVGAAAQARERVIDAPKKEGPKVELPPGAERE
jgi:hypothetical protein